MNATRNRCTAVTTSRIDLRLLLAALVTAACLIVAPHASGQPYPNKPIKFVVPFTPGGSNDVLARVVGQKLSENWRQPVVVENKPGAGGNIGADMVAKSPPDGYTFLIAANNILAINPSLYEKVPFDTLKDFAPVTMLGTVPIVLVVSPSLAAKTVKEVIALAKTGTGLTYASGGSGTPQHLSAELFKSMTGTKLVHVPYKGNAPAVTDLMGGQVQMLFSPLNSVLPHIKSGKLRAIAVASDKRIAALPDVPTIAESGVPGYHSDIWIALVAPAGTPKEIIDRTHKEIVGILGQPDVKEKLEGQGIDPASSTPEQLASVIRGDLSRWGKVVKESGARAE